MHKFIVGGAIAIFIGAAWALSNLGVWLLWCWVLPQVYPSGPPGLIAPGFWLFAACWTLMTAIARTVFARAPAAPH